MTWEEWLLGELLFLANADPPWFKQEFYQIKDRLLTLEGTWVGVHLQHVVKACYGCDGTSKTLHEGMVLGEFKTWYGGTCRRCDGTGKYEEFWTVLEYYRLGQRFFHVPHGRKYHALKDVPALEFGQQIEGYVRHERPKYYLAEEAALWLAWLYARDVFWKRFGKAGFLSRKFTPLVILSTWLFKIRHLPYDVKRKFGRLAGGIRRFQQEHCWHDFLVETDKRNEWDRCAWCGLPRYSAAVVGITDEIPF